MHIHVQSSEGEAKFWLEPAIELATNFGLPDKDLSSARTLVEEHEHAIRGAWKKHFGS
jgi:hypothetical protein